MIKKLIAIATSAALLLTCLAPAVMAAETEAGTGKPADYTRVLFFEDYEGDTTPDTTNFEWKPNAQISIGNDASATVSTKEQGSFAVVQQPTKDTDSYYRVKYGAATAPVQASGVSVADLNLVQVSMDVCTVTEYHFPLRFYDKFSGSSTKGETLIYINKNGYITFANTDVTYDCSLGEWLAIDVFLDFDADVYSVYINGSEAVSGAELKILTECVESAGVVPSKINAGETYTVYMDNFRIAVPGKFEVLSTTPSHGAIGVDVTESVQFELSDAPVNFDESMVTVAGGTAVPSYTVTEDSGIISVDFDGGLEYSTQYTVTLSGDIADASGKLLGEDTVVSFTTASAPSTQEDYDTVIYSNDFESAPVGANLTQEEINYRPENADYEIVQEGDNKYYKFSPNDTSKRANSGNLETGCFLPETVAEKPIRKVKIDMDVAVDVKGGGPATISSYYRGRVANGNLNSRYNFVEITNDKYYAATDKQNEQSYTPGDWVHFTIYANYEENLVSVYTDDGFAMENVPLAPMEGVDKFTQVRMSIQPGEGTDSWMKIDNVVYTTTSEIYDQITGEQPDIPDEPDEPDVPDQPDADMPADYNRVLYYEDFEGDTAYDGNSLESKHSSTISIVSGDNGSYANVIQPDDLANADNYFRMTYGSAKAPVQSNGVTVSELGKTQVSIDLCPVEKYQYNLRFLDKFSGTSTKGETLIEFKSDGKMKFANSSVTSTYSLGEWMEIDIFLDFDKDVYTAYIDGKKMVSNAELSTLTECVESVGVTLGAITAGQTYSVNVDNIRIATPESFKITETYPANGAKDVNVMDKLEIKLTSEAQDFDASDMFVMCNGEDVEFTAAQDNGVITVDLGGNMSFDGEYTIGIANTFSDIYGQMLAEPYVFSFTTMSPDVVSSVPVLGTKAEAAVYNPGEQDISAVLVVSVINADGSSALYTDEKTVAAGATADFAVDFDIASLTEGQTVIAYVAEDAATLKPMRDVYAAADENAAFSGSTAAGATVDKAEIVGNTVSVAGSISAKEQQTVIMTVCNAAGEAIMAVPLNTNAEGAFAHSYTAQDLPAGIYTVSVTGCNITGAVSKSYMYLDDATKNEINAAVNGAADAAAVKAQLEKYKAEMHIDDRYYCDNTYSVIVQQKPFADYDSMLAMIYKADSLLTELNNADWSKYSKLFEDNSDIMLKGAEKLDKYNDYSANKQNSINKIIVEGSPFADFAALRTAFDAAVKEYADSSSASSGGSGGGGGGGSSSGGVSTSYNVVGTSQPADTNTNTAVDTTGLFADMTAVPWAQQHVMQLYEKGIVSAANNYRPLDNVTREEFVKMLVQLAGLATDGKTADFTDVNGSEWFAPYLAAAQGAGIINGMDDGSFGVGDSITRQDMVVMAQRTVAVMNKTLKESNEAVVFADSEQISDYASDAVSQMQRAGVVSGTGNGYFEPTGAAGRAEAAVVICNLINAME